MLILDEPDLPTTAYSGLAAIACIANDPSWQDIPALTLPVGFVPGEDEAVISKVFSGTIAVDSATFTVDRKFQKVETVERNGQIYALATDPTDPQPGEFTYDYDTGQVEVVGDFPAGAKFEARATDSAIASSNPLITSLTQLPDIFQRYELQGTVEWSCSFEGQPSASFDLFCTWEAAEALKVELAPKKRKQMVLFGVGFEVETLAIKKEGLLANPDRYATVSVSLKGKWESYLDQRVILDADADVISVSSRTIRGNTTVGAIASKVGAAAAVPPHTIYAPRERNQEKVIGLEEVFTGQLRHNGLFADYCNPTALTGIELSSTPVHIVSFGDVVSESLEISVNAYPRAVDYENSPIEWGNALGEAAASKEDGQGDKANSKPEWRLKPPKRDFVVTGSPSLAAPPGVTETKDVLKMNFDSGGPVREQKTVYTEAGCTDLVTTEKWGFAGTSFEHVYSYNAATGKWTAASLAQLPWVQIEYTEAAYSYDDNGYLTGITTTGQRLARLRSEGSNEGLEAYKSWYKESNSTKKAKKARLLDTYKFQYIPVNEATAYGLDTLRSHYNDLPPAPTEEYEVEEPKFLPDGRLNRVFTSDSTVTEFEKDGQPWYRLKLKERVPGWADPQYCSREFNCKSAYLSMPNPDSTDKNPLPDFSTGEAKETEKGVFVPDYRGRPKPIAKGASGTIVTSVYQEAEVFIQSERLANQLESSFARSAKESTQTQNKGRPGEHTRKVPQYEKIDPNSETDPRNATDPEKDKYEWRVTTRDTSDPLYVGDERVVGDSISYPYAASLEQALKGLATDMDIENAANTETLSIDVLWLAGIPMQPGDRVNLEEHGLWRVLGYKKSLEIVAPGVCEPKDVSLDLGKIIPNPTVQTKRVAIAQPEDSSQTKTGQATDPSGKVITDPRQLIRGAGLGNPNGA